MRRMLILAITGILCLSFFSALKPSHGLQVSSVANGNALLSLHWVPGWGFRDELNTSDIDYQNFWMDNAGKILMESMITNDTVDAGRAFGFIQSHMTQSHYLPEVLVNSSMIGHSNSSGILSCNNSIVLVKYNESQDELENVSIGDYYASPRIEGFLGADRIWYNESGHASAYRANSSVVTALPDGFVKRAFFNFSIPGGARREFYTYLNVTMSVGDPYVRASLQIQPLDSTFEGKNYTFLQVFARPNLDNYSCADVFDANGSLNQAVSANLQTYNATGESSGGLLIAYSSNTSVLDEDSVALRFNSTDIYDVEHWYKNSAFDDLSWVGLGYQYNATVGQGNLSAPVYVDVYPIEHLDYHLLNDTGKYIVSNPLNVTVSPPVSFGFVAEGLALEAKLNPNNQTIQNLAKSYWNFYYSRYNSSLYNTLYARSINVFALAGFTLYGRNSTVEDFTRRFINNTSGDSIEEYAWAVAALHQLCEFTNSTEDLSIYRSFLDSLSVGGPHFMALVQSSTKNQLNPEWTFEFGETASGLMLDGVPFNYPIVIAAMNAVYQSNVNGTVRNKPYSGDEANTETLPAYILSTWFFENEMRNETGCWITGLENTNVTSIAYCNGTLLIQAVGSTSSSLTITNKTGSYVYSVWSFETINIPEFPQFLFLPLFMIATLFAGIVYRKRSTRISKRTGNDC
jgi:hypothetical protein